MLVQVQTDAKAACLSWDGVEALLTEPTPDARAETAAHVAAAVTRGALNERERKIALEILELLACDVERQVREALAEHVKHCPFLPRKLARTLAEDVESVALPVIRYATVLSDADLVAIVRQGALKKQLTIAGREGIGAPVSEALVDTGNRAVTAVLLGNHTAEISETAYGKVLDRFAGNEDFQGLMVARPALPLAVTGRLVQVVAGALRERLMERHDFPAELVDELTMQGRDKTLTAMLANEKRPEEAARLAADLHLRKDLTPMLVLRALCTGELAYFEAAMATLAGVSVNNARNLIHDAGPLGLRRLYERSGLPKELFRAFRAAVDVASDGMDEESPDWRSVYVTRIVYRLAREYDVVCPENLEHVLSQLSRRVMSPSKVSKKKKSAPAAGTTLAA